MADELVFENAEMILAEITARVEAAAAEAMAAVNVTAAAVEAEAKRRCPVDTGKLQASIATTPATDPTAIEATIGTPVTYGPFIENGTHKMHAQPFLLPAFVQETAKLEAALADAINRALQG